MAFGWCGGDDDGVVVGHEPPKHGDGGGECLASAVAGSDGYVSVICEGVEDFALFMPRLDVQYTFSEPAGLVSEKPLVVDLVVFRWFWLASGDGTVWVLGLGSRVHGNDVVVRGNDGRCFGSEDVGVLAGCAFILGFALVSRDASFVRVFSWHVHRDRRVPGDKTHA